MASAISAAGGWLGGFGFPVEVAAAAAEEEEGTVVSFGFLLSFFFFLSLSFSSSLSCSLFSFSSAGKQTPPAAARDATRWLDTAKREVEREQARLREPKQETAQANAFLDRWKNRGAIAKALSLSLFPLNGPRRTRSRDGESPGREMSALSLEGGKKERVKRGEPRWEVASRQTRWSEE